MTANVRNGPTPPAGAPRRVSGGAWTNATAAHFVVSPDQVKVTLTAVGFEGAAANAHQTLDNCTVTYDRAQPSLSLQLGCPFTVPAGTYDDMYVEYSTTFQVLIDDAINGIFTDPTAASGLSATMPAGGAQFIPYKVAFAGGDTKSFLTNHFKTPLVLGAEGGPTTIDVVMHALHLIDVMRDSSGALAFGLMDREPLALFPSVSGAARVEYYSSSGTGHTFDGTLDPSAGLFVMYESDGPQVLFLTANGGVNACDPAGSVGGAENIEPSEVPVGMSGNRGGGYLGLDASNTLCWALATDDTWSTNTSVWSLTHAVNVGDSATLGCMPTASAPAPTSGDTYASGCPAFTASASRTVQLVAR